MAGVRSLFILALAIAAICVQSVAAQQEGGGMPPMPNKKWFRVHGWCMWSSMGFLLPLGIIFLRFMRPQRDQYGEVSKSRSVGFFYAHVVCMSLATILATFGMLILVIKEGAGGWTFTHQRLGLALVIIMLLNPFVALVRPHKGKPVRPYWYLVHWTFGTGALFLGIINCFIGIVIYEQFFAKSLRTLNILFAIQISFMAFVYLLQDRWSYVYRQLDGRNQRPVLPKAAPHQTAAMNSL